MKSVFQPSDPHPDAGPMPSWMDDRFLTGPFDSAQHLLHPEMSAAEYAKTMRLSHYRQIAAKTKVYLDQRFWIFCRDARAGKPSRPLHAEIWQRLLKLVHAGKLICPATYPILTETFKQGDPARRMHTAETIDELSTRIGIQNPQVLAQTEMMFLLSKILAAAPNMVKPAQSVWTSAGFQIVGELHMEEGDHEDDAEALAVHKAAMDLAALMRLPDIVRSLPHATLTWQLDDTDTQRRQNALADRTRNRKQSYEARFMAEVDWSIDHYLGKVFPSEVVQSLSRIISTGFRAKPDLFGRLWPSVHIPCSIYAGIRHKSRRFERGDSYDHLHATVALPYCDYFFTERKLGTLLTEGPLRLHTLYNCRVAWKESDVVHALEQIEQSPN